MQIETYFNNKNYFFLQSLLCKTAHDKTAARKEQERKEIITKMNQG